MSGRAPRAPLSLQVFAVILGTFVLAQGLTIAAILVAPPRGAPVFTYQQIADALEGHPAAVSGSRRLLSTVRSQLPQELQAPMSPDGRVVSARLANMLNVKLVDMRFHLSPVPALVTLTSGRGSQLLAGAGRNSAARVSATQVRGEFQAAARRPDGGWTVVELSPETEWLRRLAIWVAGWVLIICPVAYLSARRITAPLRRFARAADALGRAHQVEPLEISGPAEIATAAHAFNAMQTRISRFVADRVGMMGAISHDLRTPLTRIRFKAERADPALREEILSDVERMEQMIGGVLTFIREDHARTETHRVDLASLVACAVDEAAAMGADVTMTLERAIIVEANPAALQRVFENLIGNALKYGGRARVSLATSDGEARVLIEDDGPGLQDIDLERVFQPFYRAPEAKAAADGVGLGLTVSRTIARSFGGDVVLHNGGRGLVAVVTIPTVS